MSLALHGHHALIIATLAFAAAALTTEWYTSPDNDLKRNVFQICDLNSRPYSCEWILLPTWGNQILRTIFPILIASFAIACAGMSLIGLLLGSWYIQRFYGDIGSKWLLVLTIVSVLLSFLLSSGILVIMLTTNLHQKNKSNISAVRLEDFGYSLWISIGSTGAYLYAFVIYLLAACRNS